MIWLVLNPKSGGNKASRRWKQLSSSVQHDVLVSLEEWMKNTPSVKAGDKILSAGGDGCLHSVVNVLIEKFGIGMLSQVPIGVIGLGSNNSYLQPTKDHPHIHGIPVQIQEPSFLRDLVEVEIQQDNRIQKKWIISNASMGFLAFANINFNENTFVHLIKKISVSLADVLSFFITLVQFKPVHLQIQFADQDSKKLTVTNLHWLKAPYFTKDLFFHTSVPRDSGLLDFYELPALPRWNVLGRFISMLLFKKVSSGFQSHKTISTLKITSDHLTPLEIDGEIISGYKFKFIVHQKVMRCLS